MLWASLELKEQWDLQDLMDTKAQEVNKVSQGCLEPEAPRDLLETQESQASQDPQDLQDFLEPPAYQGLKVNQELQAGSSLQRGRQLSLSQVPRDLLDPWDPQDLQVSQALSAQLVSQDSKAREASEGSLVNRSSAAAPSPRSSLLRVLIYKVLQAHLDHLGHQGKVCQVHQAHQDLSWATQRTSSPALRAHLVPEALKVTEVTPDSLTFLVVPPKGDHHPAPRSCRAHRAHRGPLGLRAPSAARAWRFSSTSPSTCRVTVLGLISLEFRVPQALLVLPGLSPPSGVRLSTTQSWQAWS